MIKIYKARQGSPFKKEEASIIGEIAEKIEKKNGNITPILLVKEAESSRSPIHHLFTWNDTEAAKEYRLHQARNIINHLEYEIINDGVPNVGMRAYYPVITAGERFYVSNEVAANSDDYAKQVVTRLIRILEGTQKELQAFNQYRWLIRILQETENKIREKVEV